MPQRPDRRRNARPRAAEAPRPALAANAGDPPVKLGSVLDFMRLLWAVDHGLQSRSKRMSARIGVTGPQRTVVRIVGASPGISAAELATVLHLHPSTLTGILRRLEGDRLIERAPDPRDARRSRIRLTDAGSRLDRGRAGTVEELVEKVLAGQPVARVGATRSLLAALAAALTSDDA